MSRVPEFRKAVQAMTRKTDARISQVTTRRRGAGRIRKSVKAAMQATRMAARSPLCLSISVKTLTARMFGLLNTVDDARRRSARLSLDQRLIAGQFAARIGRRAGTCGSP